MSKKPKTPKPPKPSSKKVRPPVSKQDDPVIVCCILGLCCPAESAQQLAAAVKLIHRQRRYLTPELAEGAAKALLVKYDYFREAGATIDAALAEGDAPAPPAEPPTEPPA